MFLIKYTNLQIYIKKRTNNAYKPDYESIVEN